MLLGSRCEASLVVFLIEVGLYGVQLKMVCTNMKIEAGKRDENEWLTGRSRLEAPKN